MNDAAPQSSAGTVWHRAVCYVLQYSEERPGGSGESTVMFFRPHVFEFEVPFQCRGPMPVPCSPGRGRCGAAVECCLQCAALCGIIFHCVRAACQLSFASPRPFSGTSTSNFFYVTHYSTTDGNFLVTWTSAALY